jgi:hypothetical protein
MLIMARKYNHIIFLYLLGVVLLFSGCKKYLEIQPEDKYTETQIFSNEHAIQEVLNGLYGNLASNSLYGANLTTTTIELLGQRYNVTSGATSGTNVSYPPLQKYTYSDVNVQPIFDDIWTQAYSNIIQTNNFITKLDQASQNGVITSAKASLLKGEAIGIRALLHFDLLRLFGPVYATSSTSAAIPYYTKAEAKTQPILPAKQVLDSVLTDLSRAATLLASDPVINGGIVATPNFYNGYRNQRLNYYAIKALQARAYLYGGNKPAAHDAAKAVLDGGEKWFPWLAYSSIVSEMNNPDRIFSPEVLFGVYNSKMYTNYTAFFSSDLVSADLLTSHPDRLISIFENNANDYRYTTTWLNTSKGRTFYKYADIVDKTKPWRFIQPLVRKSEMYYILAETETDPAIALNYLNTVRFNRGLTNLTTVPDINTEIQKEYQKEFYGEGQLFFYYKRKAVSNIPSGISGYSWATVYPVYVVPLPLSETTTR